MLIRAEKKFCLNLAERNFGMEIRGLRQIPEKHLQGIRFFIKIEE